MLLCLWWFYVQICSAFLWVFHGPFFLDKAHGNCSNSVPNPPLPLTSTPRLHAVFLASHSGLRRTWPQMQCHSVTGCSATCNFAHLVTSEIRVCTTAIKASSSWESPCSLHTGSPGEFQDRIQSNYRVENLYEFTNEYSIVISISWNGENEALKSVWKGMCCCIQTMKSAHSRCIWIIGCQVKVPHLVGWERAAPLLQWKAPSKELKHGDTQMLHAESHRPRWVLPVVSGFERSWQQLLHPQLPSDWPCEMDMIVGNGEMCIKREIAERCVRMCKVLENALYKGTLENAHAWKNWAA